MSAHLLLKCVGQDAVGSETVLRVIGSREPPAQMVLQIAIAGSAEVQVQGRIAREAPWQDIGPVHGRSALVHIEAVQFLRAVAAKVTTQSSVSVWAVWAW